MRPRSICLAVLLALGLPSVVWSADWRTIASDKKRTVELDHSSILQSDPGTKVAWGRIVLAESEITAAGYASVKALNRYDCRNRAFATIKRVFLDADSAVIREEKVKIEKDLPVAPGSVDERLWYDVCKPGSPSDMARLADEAAKAAKVSEPYRPAKGADKAQAAQLQTVSDAKADPAPAPAAPAAEAKPRVDIRPDLKAEFMKSEAAKAEAPPPPRESSRISEEAARAGITRTPPEVLRVPAAPRRVRAPAPVMPEMRMPAVDHGPLMHHHIHWSYEGEAGPANWGVLNPDWKLCSTGERQSPIDIRDGVKVELEPIRFDYRPSNFRIVNNGHTIQVNLGLGNTMSVMGRTFDLVQFHFHRPAEERINGRGFDMVVHLVHKDMDGKLGVIAVLLERGNQNPVIQTLWNNLPLEKHQDYAPETAVIDLMQLLPENRNYYTYMGSLTTPPCSEGVLWMVMKQPMGLSQEQLSIFTKLYPMNARPIQSPKGRLIKESR
ncbi:carbonic anhydrase [Zoogloea sp.]|uniref:carbonic anhydrase n=1 Tax=Zoogloea sp. TaxID=49181 RepID=UPI0035B0BF47